MASRLNPYISFTGTAKQAMEFYQQLFGGELRMNTFGEFGAADEPYADQIMHAQLDTPAGYTLMASDTPPGMEPRIGSAITISISGDDEPTLRGYWDGLSAEGTVEVPMARQMWGDSFGQCVDRFGVRWLVNISSAGTP